MGRTVLVDRAGLLGRRLDRRSGMDRLPGHRSAGPAGTGRGGRRRRHRTGRSPPSRRTCGPPTSDGASWSPWWPPVRWCWVRSRRCSRPSPGDGTSRVNDFSQSVTWMAAKTAGGAFRVLWLGDPRSLNQGSWSAGDGLAYATSEDGSPDARWLWNAADPGPASTLASAVNLARSGRTDRLGSMLAPSGVRYVVLLTSLAPEITGEQNPQEYPVPADLAPGLGRQLDLTPVVSGTGITVYANAAWIPERAQIGAATAPRRRRRGPSGAPPAPVRSSPGAPIVPGHARCSPVRPPPPPTVVRSPVGTVFTARHRPAGGTSCKPNGSTAVRSPSFGWAGRYQVTEAGVSTLRFDGGLITPLSLLCSVIVWLAAIAVVAAPAPRTDRGAGSVTGRRRPRGRTRRTRRRTATPDPRRRGGRRPTPGRRRERARGARPPPPREVAADASGRSADGGRRSSPCWPWWSGSPWSRRRSRCPGPRRRPAPPTGSRSLRPTPPPHRPSARREPVTRRMTTVYLTNSTARAVAGVMTTVGTDAGRHGPAPTVHRARGGPPLGHGRGEPVDRIAPGEHRLVVRLRRRGGGGQPGGVRPAGLEHGTVRVADVRPVGLLRRIHHARATA